MDSMNGKRAKLKGPMYYLNRITSEYRDVRDNFSDHGPRHGEISGSLQTNPLQIFREIQSKHQTLTHFRQAFEPSFCPKTIQKI